MSVGRVLFMGKLRDLAGTGDMPIPKEAGDMTLSALVAVVSADNALLFEALLDPTVRIAINKALVSPGADPKVAEHDEIAFLPPMSGG